MEMAVSVGIMRRRRTVMTKMENKAILRMVIMIISMMMIMLMMAMMNMVMIRRRWCY